MHTREVINFPLSAAEKFTGKMFYTSVGTRCDPKFVDCMLAAVSGNDKLVRFRVYYIWLSTRGHFRQWNSLKLMNWSQTVDEFPNKYLPTRIKITFRWRSLNRQYWIRRLGRTDVAFPRGWPFLPFMLNAVKAFPRCYSFSNNLIRMTSLANGNSHLKSSILMA